MAANRMSWGPVDPRDDLDEYMRDEYRAEHGAYMEHRPTYVQPEGGEPDPFYWGAGAPTFEGYARTGTGAPLHAPPYGDEIIREGRRAGPAERPWRSDMSPRSAGPRARRTLGSSWQRDRSAGHALLGAAETFYDELAGSLGLPSGRRPGPSYRGRGPRTYRRSDARLLDEVSLGLMEDPDVDASEVEVSVREQEVTLDGSVTSRFAKRRAEDIAQAVSGVQHVQNNLRIRP